MNTDVRPKNVPDDAIALTVWAGQPMGDPPTALLYGHDGIIGRVTVEYLERNYGVTFPEPEPTPESIIGASLASTTEAADLIAALDAAGFEIVRKPDTPDTPAEVPCVNCGRPLLRNDDGSVWRDSGGGPRHRDPLNVGRGSIPTDHHWCDADLRSHRHATAPEGVR